MQQVNDQYGKQNKGVNQGHWQTFQVIKLMHIFILTDISLYLHPWSHNIRYILFNQNFDVSNNLDKVCMSHN